MKPTHNAHSRDRQPGQYPPSLSAAAALSLIAALIHGWVTPEHFAEWWGYGLFFLIVTVLQAAYSVALLRWPSRPLFFLGIIGTLVVISLYLVTRTLGIPFFGPEAGMVEEVGILDLSSKAIETLLVITLAILARTSPGDSPSRPSHVDQRPTL